MYEQLDQVSNVVLDMILDFEDVDRITVANPCMPGRPNFMDHERSHRVDKKWSEIRASPPLICNLPRMEIIEYGGCDSFDRKGWRCLSHQENQVQVQDKGWR